MADDHFSHSVDGALDNASLSNAFLSDDPLLILDSHPLSDRLRVYIRAMAATSCGIVITDPTQPERPIIYCNPAFEQLTGYTYQEVVGRNCRFLQGRDTDPATIDQIRRAVRSGQGCRVVVKNYCKNGTPFWNDLTISPVVDAQGTLTHFIGVQTDVTDVIRTTEVLRQQAERERLIRTITERIYQSVAVEETLEHAVKGVQHLLQV
ncbi:MAG: PAS domain-containing protein, partial [Leptolyngbyaceae cyanobacterium SL_7_1]|nr:PAS domain-containing protein [Leptolyngbyaceae cyanobacterium SL_7_1]